MSSRVSFFIFHQFEAIVQAEKGLTKLFLSVSCSVLSVTLRF
jgi:hypothetical protein